MDYICSGDGSEFKGTYTGSKTDPQCVIPDHCVPMVGHEHVFPRKLSYIDDSGFASFSLREDVLRFGFTIRRETSVTIRPFRRARPTRTC